MKRLALKTALTTLSLLCGIGLVTVAGVLISQVTLRPPMLMLGMPIVVVRCSCTSRALLRRAAPPTSHDVACRADSLRNLYLHAGGSPWAALATSAAAVTVAVGVLRPAGVVLAAGLAVAGVLVPAAAVRMGR